ncbi:MAG: helix-turn-helix domain-containing protein [Cyanobium sp. MAG06]|nr:helix-turn-helix domain-containing protein [Cyanobium sp. MAG06]
MTLDEAEMDLSKGFGFGMGYVALSRVRSLDGMKVTGLNNQAIMMSPFILKQDKIFRNKSERAVEALVKYNNEDLNKIHSVCRVAMGGLEKLLSEEEVDKINKEERNRQLEEKTPTTIKTLRLLLDGKSIFDIKIERELTWQTVIGHLIELMATHNNKEELEIIRNSLLEHLRDFLKNNDLDENDLIKLQVLFKEDFEKESKLSPVLAKYKPEYKGLNFDILKIIMGWRNK